MSANAEQIEYWNQVSGDKWVRRQEELDAQLLELGRQAIERAAPAPGERVLDVGCGCGATALTLRDSVMPGGDVLGIDISAPMLARAAQRAAGRDGIAFLEADAQTHPFEAGTRDLVFSRFGVMFFEDPPAAFANLRRALRPGGRLAFVCWQSLADNDWMRLPVMAAAANLTLPPPPEPDAPGPFSLADADRLRGILAQAGFEEIAIEGSRFGFSPGSGDVAGAVDLMLEIGPVGAALRESPPDARPKVLEALHAVMEQHVDAAGQVRMPAAVWFVGARAPA